MSFPASTFHAFACSLRRALPRAFRWGLLLVLALGAASASADGDVPIGDAVETVRVYPGIIAAVAESGASKASDPELKAYFSRIAPFQAALSQKAAAIMQKKKYRLVWRMTDSSAKTLGKFAGIAPGPQLDGAMLREVRYSFETTIVQLATAERHKNAEFSQISAEALPEMWRQHAEFKALATRLGVALGSSLDPFKALRPPGGG